MSTPNCDKLAAFSAERSAILEFIEFAESRGFRVYTDRRQASEREIDHLFYEMIGVDPVELERERRAILEEFTTLLNRKGEP